MGERFGKRDEMVVCCVGKGEWQGASMGKEKEGRGEEGGEGRCERRMFVCVRCKTRREEKKRRENRYKKGKIFFSISFISFLYLFFSFIFFSCEHSGDISRSGEGGKGNKTEFIAMQEIMWGTKRQFVRGESFSEFLKNLVSDLEISKAPPPVTATSVTLLCLSRIY